MQITLGKISWVVSILVFIFMIYNMNISSRIYDMVVKKDATAQYNPFENQKRLGSVEPEASAEPETTLTQPEETMTTREAELFLQIERMKWEMEKLNEQLVELKVEVSELTEEKDTVSGNLIALIGALTPLLLPVITSRIGHDKQVIKLGKA